MMTAASRSLRSLPLVVAFAWPCLTQPAGPPGVSSRQAATLFARFATLAGTWRERSTRGWEGTKTFRVIADGSVVMSTSAFDDDPGDAHVMATMIALDGDRLLLTHYCEARNQPRLVATAISDDGATVTFTFLDAGNLPDRDHGHMDRAVFHFLDADRFTERWTWYQDGHQRWLEEIHAERVPALAGGR
jgi:hypothetical protein